MSSSSEEVSQSAEFGQEEKDVEEVGGEKGEFEDEPDYKLWVYVVVVIIRLGLYGVSIYFAWWAIDQWVNQSPTTAVTFSVADENNQIDFPAIQVCPLTPFSNVSIHGVWFQQRGDKQKHLGNVTEPFTEITYADTYDEEDDEDVWGRTCYEWNNVASNVKTASRSDRVHLYIDLRMPELDEFNYTCTAEDEEFDSSCVSGTTIEFDVIDPLAHAAGVAVYLFKATGTALTEPSDDAILVSAGFQTKLRTQLRTTQRLNVPETFTYQSVQSQVGYPNSASPIILDNNFDLPGGPYEVHNTVYLEVSFQDLAVEKIEESWQYTWFNAFGDGTAIAGFFTGFALWGGPTIVGKAWDFFAWRKLPTRKWFFNEVPKKD